MRAPGGRGRVHHEDQAVRVGKVLVPDGPQAGLATQVPHHELHAEGVQVAHVQADRGQDLVTVQARAGRQARLEPLQQRGLARLVQAYHQHPQLLLAKEGLPAAVEEREHAAAARPPLSGGSLLAGRHVQACELWRACAQVAKQPQQPCTGLAVCSGWCGLLGPAGACLDTRTRLSGCSGLTRELC